MLRKLFIQVGFYDDLEYWPELLENRSKMEKYGWHWKIYSRLDLPESSNVKTVKIDVEWWNQLIESRLGIKPNIRLVQKPYRTGPGRPFTQPSRHVFDFWPAFGELFKEDTKGFDYWGHMGFNIVLGNLNDFIPDTELEKWDIWSDDENMIGGPFTLYRNTEEMRSLFRKVPNWQDQLGAEGNLGEAFDEFAFTQLVRSLRDKGELAFGGKLNHGFGPVLEIKEDKLYLEGKEISFFHFTRMKTWPTILNQ